MRVSAERSAEGRVSIRVEDDGVGMAQGAPPSLGWSIVRLLTAKLGGTVIVRVEQGTHVRLEFLALFGPLALYKDALEGIMLYG